MFEHASELQACNPARDCSTQLECRRDLALAAASSDNGPRAQQSVQAALPRVCVNNRTLPTGWNMELERLSLGLQVSQCICLAIL